MYTGILDFSKQSLLDKFNLEQTATTLLDALLIQMRKRVGNKEENKVENREEENREENLV